MQVGQRFSPPDAGAVHIKRRCSVPRVVERRKQIVDGLARNIAVNQNFRQTFGQVRGLLDVERIPCEGQRAGPIGIEKNPGTPAAEFVAGPFDDVPARRESGLHRFPRGMNIRDTVLPQHIERANQVRAQPGQLKPAEREMNPIAVGEHALGIDLQAGDVDSRANSAQTGGPLAGGCPARAVTNIHSKGPIRMEERAAQDRVMDSPAITSPKSVDPCRSPCHSADGPVPAPRRCADIMGAQISRPSVGVAAIPMWGRGFVHRGCGSAGEGG